MPSTVFAASPTRRFDAAPPLPAVGLGLATRARRQLSWLFCALSGADDRGGIVKPVRSLVAAVVCALVCVVPSAAAVAATPSVTVPDGSGDNVDARVHILSASSGADAHSSIFTVTIQTPTDPRPGGDGNWDNPNTGGKWNIDTNYDGQFDYVASVVRASGTLKAVMLDAHLNPVCYGTPIYDSGSGTYSASFASGC